MTADSTKDLQYLKAIGQICAEALRRMQGAVRAGITTFAVILRRGRRREQIT